MQAAPHVQPMQAAHCEAAVRLAAAAAALHVCCSATADLQAHGKAACETASGARAAAEGCQHCRLPAGLLSKQPMPNGKGGCASSGGETCDRDGHPEAHATCDGPSQQVTTAAAQVWHAGLWRARRLCARPATHCGRIPACLAQRAGLDVRAQRASGTTLSTAAASEQARVAHSCRCRRRVLPGSSVRSSEDLHAGRAAAACPAWRRDGAVLMRRLFFACRPLLRQLSSRVVAALPTIWAFASLQVL